MSVLSEKLAEKIKHDIGLNCDADSFYRTYAGKNQKASGAFVWLMQIKNGYMFVGSCWPASECIKSKYQLVLGSYGEIFPEEVNKSRKP